MGILKPFVDHQRLVHTFATNLRGPEHPISFLGAPIDRVIPLSALSGNVAVAFAALSYAGDLTVTVAVDPDVIPHLNALVETLASELEGPAKGVDRLGGAPLVSRIEPVQTVR